MEKNNGHKTCPRCGKDVIAEVIKQGYEFREINAGSHAIPDSLTYFEEALYHCPKDGDFTYREHGEKLDIFAGC